MISPIEQKDLDELNLAVKHEKENFFAMCETIARSTEEGRDHLGCNGQTKGEAMETFLALYQKSIKKLQTAHVKKYPDDGR